MYQDMSELSDGQHKIQTLQSQQLAELPEDSDYYRELLTELEQAREQAKLSAKQKLMETAEKFENSTLVASNPSEVSCGGTRDREEMITPLVKQFEDQCQLANLQEVRASLYNRKEVVSSHNPEISQLECSKNCQWLQGEKSPNGVPDFNTILERITTDFVSNSNTDTKSYNTWLVSRTRELVSITEPFEVIAASDISQWLYSPSALEMETSNDWVHPSSTMKLDSVCPVLSANGPQMVASTNQPDHVERFSIITGPSASSWLSPDNSMSSWLSSSVSSEPVHPVQVFNTIANTGTSAWLPSSFDVMDTDFGVVDDMNM